VVEPLAEADVNDPGVMAMLVAPVATQFSVLLVPEFTLVGFAVKEVIIGAAPVPVGALDEVIEPQPASAAQANRMSASRPTSSPADRRLQNELAETMPCPQSKLSLLWRQSQQ
jgi:hypothetical protein